MADIELQHLLTSSLGLNSTECSGKVVLITGAGRGIGRQTALAFGLLGARVVIAEISDQGKQTETDIRNTGGEAFFVHTDVSISSSIQALKDAVLKAYGPVDILINNAIRCPVIPVLEMEEAAWDQVIQVNLRGTFLMSKAFLPEMLARKSGVIINMVSLDGMPGLSAYIASKRGIAGFSQSLALEVVDSGVSVIAFGPGMVDTPGIREASTGLAPRLGMTVEQFTSLSLHPAYEGWMPPEHAAAATVFLALRLSTEFHGEVTDGYTILERAGLISAAPLSANQTPQATVPESAFRLEESQVLAEKLITILSETETEFNKLPVFVRPIARNGFKGKAGLTVGDWQRTAASLKQQLSSGNLAGLRGHSSRLISLLEKLGNYYRGVPAETSRFTRDAEFLKEVQRIAEERLALLQAMTRMLETL